MICHYAPVGSCHLPDGRLILQINAGPPPIREAGRDALPGLGHVIEHDLVLSCLGPHCQFPAFAGLGFCYLGGEEFVPSIVG